MNITTHHSKEWSGVREADYPALYECLDTISHDGGGRAGWSVYLLERLQPETLRSVNDALAALDGDERDILSIGEESSMQAIAGRSEILTAANGLFQAFHDNGSPHLMEDWERTDPPPVQSPGNGRELAFTPDRMLDNAATACQERVLLEPHVRGAMLRSFAQFLRLNEGVESATLLSEMEKHDDWDN